ncbi:MAG: hypothetical protein QJR14_02925 [Bacillota bacterium]|nr:hypothetical protein [Bacillota bacterium]
MAAEARRKSSGEPDRGSNVIDARPQIAAALRAEEARRRAWRRESLMRLAEHHGITYETARREYGHMCDELWPPVRIPPELKDLRRRG